ncbi:MAG: PP2C family serine/threonine-protein phosphatase [Anaerolineales bacterium]
MPPVLESDVGYVHIAGGGLRTTPPPGTLARSAPRRAGRGRSEDLLFLTFGIDGGPVPSGFLNHLTEAAANAYFRTPGSVTAALRESAVIVNNQLLDLNAQSDGSDRTARFLAAVLRGVDLYLAQCGLADAALIRDGSSVRFSSSEAAKRPLGIAPTPAVRYHHLEVRAGDLVLLTTATPPSWSDPVLSAISDLEPAPAIEQLSQVRTTDTTGLLLRMVPEGQAAAALESAGMAAAGQEQAAPSEPRVPIGQRLAPLFQRTAEQLQPITDALRGTALWIGAGMSRLLVRLAPGLIEPPRPGEFSPALLATTAIAIPLIVLAVVAVVYLGRGRSQQLQAYLTEAQNAANSARAMGDPLEARQEWALAKYWLDQADQYGESDSLHVLKAQVQSSLDELDLVNRVSFTPLINGGFGGDTRLTKIAATASDVFVLDSASSTIWHAWATGRGYEMDRDFDCLAGPDSVPGMGTPVDLAIQAEPGALGAEGVVAIDADGTLLYCAADRRSLTAQITPPDTGFGRIGAIDVFNDTLYILDPQANQVWLYDATGGLFSGEAGIFFVGDVPDLHDAVDIAKSPEDLFMLHADASLDRCLRTTDSEGSGQIAVTCEQDLRFQDERPGASDQPAVPGVDVRQMIYSPPPEPSLFFLDVGGGSIYHYSMRMVYQGQIVPDPAFDSEVTALTLGPPNDLFIAAGDQVYFTQLR